MTNFKDWLQKDERILEHAGSPGSKSGLYPSSYGGIDLYCPSDFINWAADSLVYMSKDWRKLDFVWGQGLRAKPEGLEIKNIPDTDPEPEIVGRANFKWGEGMLSKPSDLKEKLHPIVMYKLQPVEGRKLIFNWSDGMRSKPDGICDYVGNDGQYGIKKYSVEF